MYSACCFYLQTGNNLFLKYLSILFTYFWYTFCSEEFLLIYAHTEGSEERERQGAAVSFGTASVWQTLLSKQSLQWKLLTQ